MAGVQNTLYVGNIPGGATEEAVMALFQSCGQIQQVRLAGDPSYQNRFAFVQFQDQNQANMGLSMDGMTFMDRQLKVSIARTPLTNPALAAAAGQQPQQGYGAYGQQQPAYGQQQAYGGYGQMPGGYGQMPGGMGGMAPRPRNHDPSRVANTVHLSNVDFSLNEIHLAQYFSVCGEVVGVRIAGQASKSGWVEFRTLEAAQAALSLNGQILGANPLSITPSRSAIHHNGLPANWNANAGADPAAAQAAAVPQAAAMPQAAPVAEAVPAAAAPAPEAEAPAPEDQ